MNTAPVQVAFAPELYIDNGIKGISFYKNAFNATENLCFKNDDDSIHVAELVIEGAIFHVHEVTSTNFISPSKTNACTCCIGLFVPDVDTVINKAVAAGAIEISPAQDYDYGYRQGTIKDPFGHFWQIQKKI